MAVSRRLLLWSLLLSCLCACFIGHGQAKQRSNSWSKWRRPPAPPAAPGQHMFREGRDALEWDSVELTRIRELHSVDMSNREAYMSSPNLASFVGLHPVETLHMPVPLSIVFIGFQGDGNLQLDIKDMDLVHWFSSLDQDLPHVRVSLSELSCSEDGHCAGQMEAAVPPSPLPTHVHLNFSCNVVVVKPGVVLQAFERAISAFSRPVDPAATHMDQQVDAAKMEHFIEGFLEELGLTHTYTLLVLNPKWSASLPAYGYRMGFSEPEIVMLAQQLPQMRLMAQGGGFDKEPIPPGYTPGVKTRPLHRGGPRSIDKYKISDFSRPSETWARAALAYLEQQEDHTRQLLKLLGPRTAGALGVARAVSLLTKQKKSELGSLLAASVTLKPEHLHNAKFRASHPLSDCITPAWVGHGRWALLDLTARRTDWGPALGGDGIINHLSLPDVHHAFVEVNEKKRALVAAKTDGVADEKLREELATTKAQRLAQLQHRIEHAQQMSRVHGVEPGEDVNPDGSSVKTTADQGDLQSKLLQAELVLYEEFATRHCHNVVNPPLICMEMKETFMELKHELSNLSKNLDQKPHAINHNPALELFGLSPDVDADPELSDTNARAKDAFLAELTNVLSRALRHVIAPPTATWHHEGYLHDTASPYAHNVHFTLYMIMDNSRTLGQWRQRGVSFDTDKFKEQVLRLMLPHQKFSFSRRDLNLLDDPALAAAFSSSLRASFLEVPHAVSDPIQHEQLYLDSRELALRLRQRFEHAPRRRASASDPHSTLEVPVFVFQLDRDIPVLVDEHYNAKALEDMILVVQNAANQDEHPTGMMCDAILLARPLSPLKHALAAVLQHLGGVLPPHLGYSPSRQLVTHDWLWSVGAHPLSWTAGGTSFAAVQIDALHRSYLLDALDSSIEVVNTGINLLVAEVPSEAGHDHLLKGQHLVRQALQTYSQLVSYWHQVVVTAADLDFGAAAEMISLMEAMSNAFLASCKEVKQHLHPHRCRQRTVGVWPEMLFYALVTTVPLAALAMLVVVIWPRFKKKTHQS